MADSSNPVAALIDRLSSLEKQLKLGDMSTIGVRNDMLAAAKELIDTIIIPEEHSLQRAVNVSSNVCKVEKEDFLS